MIKQNQRLLNFVSRLIDFCLLLLAYLVSTYIRFDIMYGAKSALSMVWSSSYVWAAVIYAGLIVFLYQLGRLYAPARTRTFTQDVVTVLWNNLLGTAFLTAFLYVTRIVDFSRIAIAMFYVIASALILLNHGVVRVVLRWMRARGYNLKHVIIVGNGQLAHQYARVIQENPRYGYKLDGYCCLTDREALGKRLGTYEDLDHILHGNPGIDEVIVALEPHETDFLPQIIEACDRQGTRPTIIPFFNNYTPNALTIDIVGDCKLIRLRTSPLDNMAMTAMKRAFDIVGSLLLLILFSPFMLIAAIGTKLSSPGPVIFKQTRMGRGKRPFTMFKFRSMRLNAKENSGWTTDADPRKTRFGSFLRKTSLDETPQFFNVLRGEMSLVGPRPEMPHFVDQFRETIPLYMVKHQVRPGITGWAQVNGYRGDTSIEERIKHDIWYIENWSLGLDIKILLRTVFGGMVNREKVG